MMNRTFKKVVKMAAMVITAAALTIPSALTANAASACMANNHGMTMNYCCSANTFETGTYTVSGTLNYLALRNAACYGADNEIGSLYNGDVVEVTDASMSSKGYVYVYAPSLGKSGYVNKRYLTSAAAKEPDGPKALAAPACHNKVVSGVRNYLALRSDACYDYYNEIGQLHNGDEVEMADPDMDSNGYVYVYSPSLHMYGYVDEDYLY